MQIGVNEVIVWKFQRQTKNIKIPTDIFSNLTFNAIPYHDMSKNKILTWILNLRKFWLAGKMNVFGAILKSQQIPQFTNPAH